MLRSLKFFLWELGLINMSHKELGVPTEEAFIKGLGDVGEMEAVEIDASQITSGINYKMVWIRKVKNQLFSLPMMRIKPSVY